MFCTACGHDGLDAGSRFCPECGAKVEPSNASPAEPESAVTSPEAKPPVASGSDAAAGETASEGAARSGSGPEDGAPTDADTSSERTTVDVRMDVGRMSGASKAVGLEVGEVKGDLVNEGDYVAGDNISATIGNVGAGAQVAVGKNVQQSGAGPAALSDAERRELETAFAALSASIDELDLPIDKRLVGREFLSQLGKAMLNQDAPPDAATIQVLGDWLLENLPGIKPGLAKVFTSPAGKKVLALAGEPARGWASSRLG